MILGWCLYYGDGSTFSHEDGSWRKAPKENVQGLLYWTEDGPTRAYGQDAPYRLPGKRGKKHGRTIADEDYERIRERIDRDAEQYVRR